MNHATKEGTFAYLKQFSNFSKDFYRFNGEYFVSSLGLGTFRKEPYREENYIINYKEALKSAILGGMNLIDTAINYRYQVSEQEIGEALEELFAERLVQREALVVASKAGFIPLEFPFPKDPYGWIREHIIESGLASKDEVVIDQHCMSPKYLQWSLERTLKNLKLETLDICYLHNPETQLGYVPRDVVLERIKGAFKLFEELVAQGKIRSYGIASWNAFLFEDEHTEYLSLGEIFRLAREVGGINHHFKYIQSPYNLAKPHAYNYSNQKGPDGNYYTLLQAAHGYGINFVASSSLLQMNLFKGEFSQSTRELLSTQQFSDVGSALQFARSGGVMSALFGSIHPQHIRENLMLAYIPQAKMENMQSLFEVHNAL